MLQISSTISQQRNALIELEFPTLTLFGYMVSSMMKETNAIEQLYAALVELVTSEPLEKISVAELTQQAGVSRSTFYRHFYDKYALLNGYYNTVLEQTLYRYERDLCWTDALTAIYSEIARNLVFYQNALKSTRMNSLKTHIFRISRDFHFSILKKNGVDLTNWQNIKAMEAYIYGNLEIMCDWIKTGMQEPIADMIRLQSALIPARFTPYFSDSPALAVAS